MDVTDRFVERVALVGVDVGVVVAFLPEVLAVAFEEAGGFLFDGLDEMVEREVEALVDEEVDVLGHEDVSVYAGAVAGAGLLEDLFYGPVGL